MSIQEGINELCSIRSDYSLDRPPIIFLDESSVRAGDSGIFQFRRNILRLLNLVVVLMGTDAAASNFVSGKSVSGSRGNKKDWCHIFFKLAPTDPEYLIKNKKKILKIFPSYGKSLINMIFEFLKDERPLFANYIIDRILNFPARHPKDKNQLVPYFCELLVCMFNEFQDAKVDLKLDLKTEVPFNDGQLSFVISIHRQLKNNMRNPDIDARMNDDEATKDPIFIHRHIASLEIPPNVIAGEGLSYVTVLSTTKPPGNNELFLLNNRSKKTLYKLSCCFPSFKETPLTGLAFAGLTGNLQNLLKIDEKRISTIDAFNDVNSFFPTSETVISTFYNGSLFEKIAHCAAIYASHYKSFEHLNIIEFLQVFIRELCFKAEFDENGFAKDLKNIKIVKKVKNGKNFRMVEMVENVEWKDIRMPFCGLLGEEWNADIEKYLTDHGAFLATAHYPSGGSDFYMEAPDTDGKIFRILNIECKLHHSNVAQAETITIIETLMNCTGKFNIALCAKFGALDFQKLDEKIIEKIFCSQYIQYKKNSQRNCS